MILKGEGGQKSFYYCIYIINISSINVFTKIIIISIILDTPYILENLEAHRTYQFRFAAINDVGTSDWGSQEQRTMPKRSAPEEPKILVIKDVDTEDYINSPYGNSYEVNWKIPADNGEPINMYNVHYCVVSTKLILFTQI